MVLDVPTSRDPWNLDRFPLGHSPVYATNEPNASVPLHTGTVELSDGLDTYRKDGTISLVWLPFPRIEIRVEDFSSLRLIENNDEWRMSIPGRSGAWSVFWTRATPTMPGSVKQDSAVGRLFDGGTFDGAELSSVTFHIANGPDYMGAFVRDVNGTGGSMTRLVAVAGPWKITLDAIGEWQKDEARRNLRASGGYAITHVGRMEREDGQPFAGTEVTAPLENFGWLLSFCRAAWTFPLLLVGEGADTHGCRQIWHCPRIDADARHRTWFNMLSSEGFNAFPGLVAKLADATWNEPIRHSLHWYIVCNKPRPVSIEGAIVLQQAAFELLAWTLLVEDRRTMTDKEFSALPASGPIRQMLSTCGIPLDVPSDLNDLLKVAKAENWQDGPHATTEIRNAIVHASPKKRLRIFGHGHDARTDAWILGQWFLELILLRLFDYSGHYSNRLRRTGAQGTEVEPVPWAE